MSRQTRCCAAADSQTITRPTLQHTPHQTALSAPTARKCWETFKHIMDRFAFDSPQYPQYRETQDRESDGPQHNTTGRHRHRQPRPRPLPPPPPPMGLNVRDQAMHAKLWAAEEITAATLIQLRFPCIYAYVRFLVIMVPNINMPAYMRAPMSTR